MKNSLSLKPLTQAVSHFLGRFHVIIYTLTIVVGVSVAVFMLNNLLSTSNDIESAARQPLTADEEETIKRINSFQISGGEDNFSLPAGRVNPFSP